MTRSLPIGRNIRAGDSFRLADVAERWAERRAAILASYARTRRFVTTAREFGISGERVRQIVKRFGRAA